MLRRCARSTHQTRPTFGEQIIERLGAYPTSDIDGGSSIPISAAKPDAMDSPGAGVPIKSMIWVTPSLDEIVERVPASPS
jgi:hypothetical protein